MYKPEPVPQLNTMTLKHAMYMLDNISNKNMLLKDVCKADIYELYGIAWALKHNSFKNISKFFTKPNDDKHTWFTFTYYLLQANPKLIYNNVIQINDRHIISIWIRTTKSDVPQWMRVDPSTRIGYFKWTPAFIWVSIMGSEPPTWMIHDPRITDINGWTLCMYWIYYVKTSPPKWMIHDLSIIDDDEWDLIMYWNERIKTPLPKWLEQMKIMKDKPPPIVSVPKLMINRSKHDTDRIQKSTNKPKIVFDKK